eukprot:scaffold2353_cov167-Amphora_coffeaeformis.AAC.15
MPGITCSNLASLYFLMCMTHNRGQKFLSANIVYTANQASFGNQFRLLKGPTSTVLAFGFLYNMKENDPMLTVKEVETVVEEQWFADALRKPGIDAILVLAHMGFDDELVTVILTKIRAVLGAGIPVQFITGHTHVRGASFPDTASASFEAGRYLDTVGFVSFPRKATLAAEPAGSNTTDLFTHEFLDASRAVLENTLNGPVLGTDEGTELSAFIHRIQTELGLREVVGCAPQRYYYSKSISATDSIWGLFHREVVPRVFEEKDVVMLRTDAARYDLLPGDLIFDEIVAAIPFNDTLLKISNIPAEVLLQLNETLNAKVIEWMPDLPIYTFASAHPIVASVPALDSNSTNRETDSEMYDLIISEFSLKTIKPQLDLLYPQMVSEPIALPMGSLDVWFQFFREEHLCQTDQKGLHRPSWHPNHGNSTGMPHIGFPEMANEEKDRVRFFFAIVALGMVVLLGSFYAWQRGSLFRRDFSARQMVILQAQREFEEGDADDYNDDDFDNELL